MYQPAFNQVLVELDTEDAKWGTGNDDSMMGKSYKKGRVISLGVFFATADYPMLGRTAHQMLKEYQDKDIMYNEGVEAGKTFEHDGKQYAMINYWDIVGVKQDDE